MGRRGEQRQASLGTRQHGCRGKHMERPGTGIPMWVVCSTSLPQFPHYAEKDGAASSRLFRAIRRPGFCITLLSAAFPGVAKLEDPVRKIDCSSGHGLSPDSSVWPGNGVSGRRQKFPRAERPLTGMTDATQTGSSGGSDDDWNASPGHQSRASGERSWKPRPQANPSLGQAPPQGWAPLMPRLFRGPASQGPAL